MFSKFDTNPQSDELTAADLYDAQGEWEAQQEEELSDFEPLASPETVKAKQAPRLTRSLTLLAATSEVEELTRLSCVV